MEHIEIFQKVYSYTNSIKRRQKPSIYNVVNVTLVSNPYASNFPKDLIFCKYKKNNTLKLFVVNAVKFYASNFVRFVSFLQIFTYHKLFCKKQSDASKGVAIDVFFSVDKIAKDKAIHEGYFSPLYKKFSERGVDFNTTLQAIATADVLNKKFNMKLRKAKNILIYKKKNEVDQLLSGGTNSLTAVLADQTGVRFQGASLGTFARQIVKHIVNNDAFYNDIDLIKEGYLISKELVIANIGEPIL